MTHALRFVLAALVVVGAGIVRADDTIPFRGVVQSPASRVLTNRRVSLDPCRTVAASATVTLGPTASQVQNASPNASYSTNGCRRHVVDINVGHLQSIQHTAMTFRVGGGAADMTFGPGSGLTPQQCAAVQVNVSTYKKASGESSFTRIGGGRLTGHWSPGGDLFAAFCSLDPDANFQDVGELSAPVASRTSQPIDVYRVAVDAKLDGVYRRVSAGATRTPQPS